MEVKCHPCIAPYGPYREFHDVSREVAHPSDVDLGLKCLSSTVPRVCVDMVEGSQLARNELHHPPSMHLNLLEQQSPSNASASLSNALYTEANDSPVPQAAQGSCPTRRTPLGCTHRSLVCLWGAPMLRVGQP
jgi:hypothetical protein